MIDPAMFGMGSPMPAPEPAAPRELEDIINEISQLLTEAASQDGTVDAMERADITKIMAMVAKLGANRAKQEQAALGGGPATQYLSRTLGG